MQRTATDFQRCRTTPDGLISVVEAIRYIQNCSAEDASRLWQVQSQDTTFCILGRSVEFYQISTHGGHKTPVATFSNLFF